MNDRQQHFLVLRSQSGDRQAFDRLLSEIQGPLSGYVSAVTGTSAQSDDIVQEVLIQIVRDIRYLNEPRYFRAWCFRIAARTARRMTGRRHRTSAATYELTHEPEDPLPARLDAESRAVVVAEVSKLPRATREVIGLRYLEGFNQAEVADILAIPLGTVKSRLAYGLKRLRESNTILDLIGDEK